MRKEKKPKHENDDKWLPRRPVDKDEYYLPFSSKVYDELMGLGEDAQFAAKAMQEIIQKQEQTFQMMSNISVKLHAVLKNVIRKMGGR
jgi:hypothetical protein